MTDKKLEEAIETFIESGRYGVHMDGIRDGFIAGAKWREENPEWISIKERLPQDYHINYLVFCKHTENLWELESETKERRVHVMRPSFWTEYRIESYDQDAWEDLQVTHWMPLPPKPEGV